MREFRGETFPVLSSWQAVIATSTASPGARAKDRDGRREINGDVRYLAPPSIGPLRQEQPSLGRARTGTLIWVGGTKPSVDA